MKINKTNAARLLDKAKIAYELIPYEVDENDLSAIHVADSLGENIEQVFKTLVLHGDPRIYPVKGSNSFIGIRSHFLLPEALAANFRSTSCSPGMTQTK